MGHEGPGSLLAALKVREIVHSVYLQPVCKHKEGPVMVGACPTMRVQFGAFPV
jgi:hypothetical protein